nr:aspartate-semialdehyde dehydrogenase [Dermacoccus nishinomiyaensis]
MGGGGQVGREATGDGARSAPGVGPTGSSGADGGCDLAESCEFPVDLASTGQADRFVVGAGAYARNVTANQPERPVLAVVGPTGLVGQAVIDVLATRADAWDDVRLFGSDRSVGRRMLFGVDELEVEPLDSESFAGVDVAIFATPADVSAKWAPFATASDCLVVDTSAAFRDDDDVPLVVPEVNAAAAFEHPRGMVAMPSGPAIVMLPVLATLHEHWSLTHVTATSMQAVTGAGKRGAERLYEEVSALTGHPRIGQMPGDVRRYVADLPDDSPFPAPIVSNVVPWVGEHVGGGWSSEENDIAHELRDVLALPQLRVAVTCVQVPIVTTHMSTLHVSFDKKVKPDDARRAIVEGANGAIVMPDENGTDWPTPADAVGTDPVWVGRVRQVESNPHTLDFIVCGDNIRKGAALNALQIAEMLVGVGRYAQA